MIRPNRRLRFICKSGDFELYQGITRGSQIKSEVEAVEISGGHIPAFFIKKDKQFTNLQKYIDRRCADNKIDFANDSRTNNR